MLRVIVREVNCAASANVGGPVDIRFVTFDIDAPAVESFLKEPERAKDLYTRREVIGCEVLPADHAGAPDGR